MKTPPQGSDGQTPEARTDRFPFRYLPEDAGMEGSNVEKRIFPTHPGLLLRSDYFGSNHSDRVADIAVEMRREFESLEGFGIHTPPLRLAVFKDRGVIHDLTDRIDGTTLEELLLTGLNPEMLSAYETLITAQSLYVKERYIKREPFLPDIFGLGQYMYGKLPKDDEPHIYMQDTDFLTGLNYENNASYSTNYDCLTLSTIGLISQEIREVEEATGANLAEARQSLDEILALVPQSKYKDTYKELIQATQTLPLEEAREIEF